MRNFDAVIIGAGQAGLAPAGRLNDAGQSVAIMSAVHASIPAAARPRRSWRALMRSTRRGAARRTQTPPQPNAVRQQASEFLLKGVVRLQDSNL